MTTHDDLALISNPLGDTDVFKFKLFIEELFF